jgi:hypothetical protein
MPITLSYSFTAKPQGDTGHKSKGSIVSTPKTSMRAFSLCLRLNRAPREFVSDLGLSMAHIGSFRQN